MPILDSSNSAPNKTMMSKYGHMEIHLSDWVKKHCGKRRNCLLWAISSFPTMFSKAVSCWCVKMSICWVKGQQVLILNKFDVFQVSIAGQPQGVEAARIQIRVSSRIFCHGAPLLIFCHGAPLLIFCHGAPLLIFCHGAPLLIFCHGAPILIFCHGAPILIFCHGAPMLIFCTQQKNILLTL